MNDALRLKSALSFSGVVLGVTFDLETNNHCWLWFWVGCTQPKYKSLHLHSTHHWLQNCNNGLRLMRDMNFCSRSSRSPYTVKCSNGHVFSDPSFLQRKLPHFQILHHFSNASSHCPISAGLWLLGTHYTISSIPTQLSWPKNELEIGLKGA